MMSMTSVTITVPAHLVPGGLPTPNVKAFGYNGFERSFVNSGQDDITTFTFFSPVTGCTESQFNKELEKYFWHFAKGTPFNIKKEFDDQTTKHHSCKYLNEQLIQESIA
ncbi:MULTISPECIES: hypothetical protein [unclassified Photobacterium]|uniref:hypothetical protein n=1 Tax=unclassified Photobacterium TaxID=2628852 RepID=UPI001E521B23|nr:MULTISPECIES: hypothetical protein [unclassified Photobacterium]